MVVPFTKKTEGGKECVYREKREKKRGGKGGWGRTEMGKIIKNIPFLFCVNSK